MALAKETKEQVVSDFRTHDADTGSPQVQVALLSKRINELTDHFKTHKKDNHSRRGLLKMVSQRRSLLDYLKRTDIERYHEVVRTSNLCFFKVRVYRRACGSAERDGDLTGNKQTCSALAYSIRGGMSFTVMEACAAF